MDNPLDDPQAFRARVLADEQDLVTITLNGPIVVMGPDGFHELYINGLTVPDAAARLVSLGFFQDPSEALDYVQRLVREHDAWKARQH